MYYAFRDTERCGNWRRLGPFRTKKEARDFVRKQVNTIVKTDDIEWELGTSPENSLGDYMIMEHAVTLRPIVRILAKVTMSPVEAE